MSTVPSDADALYNGPSGHVRAHRVDDAGDFVSGHAGIHKPRGTASSFVYESLWQMPQA
jgi:hypothetical protein